MIQGRARFDGIAVGEIQVNFLGPTLHIEAKAAFVNTKTGDTHGWTKHTQWSEGVVAKLRELRALMEVDLGQVHFDGGSGTLTESPQQVARGKESGLGEHLGTGIDVPSI